MALLCVQSKGRQNGLGITLWNFTRFALDAPIPVRAHVDCKCSGSGQGQRQHWRQPLLCEAGVVLGRKKCFTDVKHLLCL